MERIIKAGKRTGRLRPDFGVDDFSLLFATVPVDQPPALRERWLDLVLHGVSAEGSAAREPDAHAPGR
jgi:hypothetical protein